jgi:peptidylprolyl isomerase
VRRLLSLARVGTIALIALALLVAGCGGKSKSKSTNALKPAPGVSVPPAPGETNLKVKPKVPKGIGSPPTALQKRDIVVGKGPPAQTGQKVMVQYVGVSYTTGQQFDASWDRHQPFVFQLGAAMVIPGWDQGVVGMKVGGRRQLIIPPDLAYGPQGQPPAIQPNETLVFDIDLLKVK